MIVTEKKYSVQDAFQRELSRSMHSRKKAPVRIKKMELAIIEHFSTYQSLRDLLENTPFIIIPREVLELRYVVQLTHRDLIRRLHNGMNLNCRNKARSLRLYTIRLVDDYIMVLKRERNDERE